MNDIKEGLKRIFNKVNPGIPILFIAVALLVIGTLQAIDVYGNFDPVNGNGSRVSIDYLDGPVCDIYSNDDVFEYYLYTGSTSDGYYIALGSPKESGINLFGKDFSTKSEGYALKDQIFTGKKEVISEDVADFIAGWYNITVDDVYYNFGNYYLDTTQSSFDPVSTVFFALSAVLFAAGIISFRKFKKQ